MADYKLLRMGAQFESKRIFVTGGTGFLGGAVRRSLAERGVTDVHRSIKHRHRPLQPCCDELGDR